MLLLSGCWGILGYQKHIRIRSVRFKSDQVKVCESSEEVAHPRPSASFKKTRSEGPVTSWQEYYQLLILTGIPCDPWIGDRCHPLHSLCVTVHDPKLRESYLCDGARFVAKDSSTWKSWSEQQNMSSVVAPFRCSDTTKLSPGYNFWLLRGESRPAGS